MMRSSDKAAVIRIQVERIRMFLLSVVLLQCSLCIQGSNSFVIRSQDWNYKGHLIGYDEAFRVVKEEDAMVTAAAAAVDAASTAVGVETSAVASSTLQQQQQPLEKDQEAPILVLNGFGVGSFHQHRLMQTLLEKHDMKNRVIYCVDYLGQGRSWPIDCQDGMSKNEHGLIYSADTWLDQLVQFIEQVILPSHSPRTKLHLVGNSLGGHLAVFLAAMRPDLIESVCLMNATPVWGLNLPGWSGVLPPPKLPKAIGRYLFDRIRDYDTIRKFLQNSYSNPHAYDETLVNQIRGCTEGQGGHAAFASILWSPPASPFKDSATKIGFFDCLSRLECDVLLMFGKDDPWCKPAFGKKMLMALEERSCENNNLVHRYVELSNVGHCPNHEAPEAAAQILSYWVSSPSHRQYNASLISSSSDNDRQEKKMAIQESWGKTMVQEKRQEDIPLNFMDRLATTFVA